MPEKPPAKKFDKKAGPPPAPSGTPVVEIIIIVVVGLVILPLIWVYFSSAWQSGLSDVVLNVFALVKMAATIISMAALAIATYALLRLLEITGEQTKKLGIDLTWEHERTEKNERWERVEEQMRSLNPSDWKMAILEADNILDAVVKRMGYRGETLGERMKMIEPSDFPYLDEAWKAHKTRNDIAHKGGPEFVLSRSLAEHTINIYHRVFKELGYL